MSNRPIVFVYNLLQDIIDTFRVLEKEEKEQLQLEESTWFNENELLGILAQFPHRKKYYCIFPDLISEKFIQYACQLLKVQRSAIQILVPKKQTDECLGSICEYFMQDKQLVDKFRTIPDFDIVSSCVSDEYLQLCETFRSNSNIVDSVKSNSWQKIKRFATKQGIREMVDQLNDPQIFMPKGKILYKSEISFDDAIVLISQKLKNQSIVIKSQKYFAGRGVLIIKRQEVNGLNQDQIEQYVREKMKKPFWKCFDLVIQELIDVNPDIGPPCFQIYIPNDGNVSTVWVSAMIMEDQKNFVGIQSGSQLFKKQVKDKMTYAAITIGKIYFNLGYRGYINIDFLVDKNDTVYLGQSNVRRSASLFIHNFVSYLHGRDYQKSHYIMTHDINSQKFCNMTLTDLLADLQKLDLKYSKQKQRGVVVTTEKSFKSTLLEIFTLTRTRQQAFSIGKKLRQIYP